MTRSVVVVPALLAVVAAGSTLALDARLGAVIAVVCVGGAAWFAVRVRSQPSLRPAEATEPEARTGETDFRPILDHLAEGVLLLDGERRVMAANEAAGRILARPRDSMVGVSLIRASRDHALVELLRESSGEPRELVLADQRTVLATASRVDRDPVQTVVVLQDLTSLRRAERARQDLVANVSHELRTPIAAALALAETLEDDVDDAEVRERFAARLAEEIRRLAQIVDRLLRLSRIEARVEDFQIETVAVSELLAQAIHRVEAVAGRRGVEVTGAPSPSLSVRGDRERIEEVLTNLLDNAIRFSPPAGRVRLDTAEDGSMVRFSVSDEGPGIGIHDRLRVFERFYTGDQARAGAEGESGTGLGLAIARHIVTRLGGEIWVGDETPGATLHFTLPRAGPDAPAD